MILDTDRVCWCVSPFHEENLGSCAKGCRIRAAVFCSQKASYTAVRGADVQVSFSVSAALFFAFGSGNVVVIRRHFSRPQLHPTIRLFGWSIESMGCHV